MAFAERNGSILSVYQVCVESKWSSSSLLLACALFFRGVDVIVGDLGRESIVVVCGFVDGATFNSGSKAGPVPSFALLCLCAESFVWDFFQASTSGAVSAGLDPRST